MLRRGRISGVDSDGKRVLCVVRWPVGGIRTYMISDYPYLIERGYRFTFLGPADDTFEAFREEVAGWEGVEFVGAPIVRAPYCRMWPSVRRQLRSGRFALVHAQGFKSAFQSLVGGIGIRVPQVVTVHDVIRPLHIRGLSGAIKVRVLGRVLERADAIISGTDDVRDNFLSYWPSLASAGRELVTIPHGIDLRRLSAEDDPTGADDLRGRLGLAPGVFLMGFLGRFMEQKGFLPLLDALEALAKAGSPRPYHLLAVGSGDYARQYRREVERRGLGAVLSFRDFVPNVASILRQLDLLVMPSLWEAAPLLAIEAMSLGVPILGSDCIGLREVLRGTPSVTFPAGDAGALTRSLQDAMVSPRVPVARSFAEDARRRFNAERSAQSLLEVYDRLRKRC